MKIDFSSTAWLSIAAHLNDRLQRLREDNDHAGPPHVNDMIRGEIRLCKQLLALPETANRDMEVSLAAQYHSPEY